MKTPGRSWKEVFETQIENCEENRESSEDTEPADESKVEKTEKIK